MIGAREDSSSSDFRGIHTCVNVDGVIMCLKAVKDARAEKFWKKYSFSPSVQVAFSSSRPQAADCKK